MLDVIAVLRKQDRVLSRRMRAVLEIWPALLLDPKTPSNSRIVWTDASRLLAQYSRRDL
jgi:hypothetical protein